MKILVFGAGAIGSLFGGFLSRFHEVTLLGRPWHLEVIRKEGLRVEGIWGRHCFRKFQLATDARSLFRSKPFFDLILMTVKSYDTGNVARFLGRRIDPQTLILSLQNGIGNIETLHRNFSPRQVLAGRIITGVEIRPGKIKVTVSADRMRIGETVVGAYGPTPLQTTDRVRFLARTFSKMGLPTSAVRDVEKYLWAKVIYNCALNPLASLLGVSYGTLAEHESTRFLMNQIIREGYQVAKRKKVHLVPSTPEGYLRLFYQKLVPRTARHYPSMLRDLREGRRTEIEALNGAVVRLGRSVSVPVPYNELLTHLIRSREDDNDGPTQGSAPPCIGRGLTG